MTYLFGTELIREKAASLVPLVGPVVLVHTGGRVEGVNEVVLVVVRVSVVPVVGGASVVLVEHRLVFVVQIEVAAAAAVGGSGVEVVRQVQIGRVWIVAKVAIPSWWYYRSPGVG